MREPRMTVGSDDRWEPRLHPREQRPDFNLVGTSWTIVIHEIHGDTYDVLVRFFPCRVYIDSNHCDTLRYEWPLARCCHLVVCLVLDG
jgi:hypothetical protein